MYRERKELYEKVESLRGSKVIACVTGDRGGMETQISNEILDYLPDHFDLFGSSKKLSLILHSRGGNTLAGWGIANLIRQYFKNFEVIIPVRAHSTATLISIAADSIIMTKRATLGPIDPSVNSPLNPPMPGQPPQTRVSISVEAAIGYFELAKNHLKIKKSADLSSIYLKLSDFVHPIALGNVYRAREQIQMLAERLLKFHMSDKKKIKKIVSILCGEAGSHDYSISSSEARNDLSLPVEEPDQELYTIIKEIHSDVRKELELGSPYNPVVFLGGSEQKSYEFKRALIESREGGSHRYESKGVVSKIVTPGQTGAIKTQINDTRSFEGWTHEQ